MLSDDVKIVNGHILLYCNNELNGAWSRIKTVLAELGTTPNIPMQAKAQIASIADRLSRVVAACDWGDKEITECVGGLRQLLHGYALYDIARILNSGGGNDSK